MTPAVFLDRDGTMIHDVGYLSRREDVTWYPWAIDAIRLLNRAGFLVIVVTNTRNPARLRSRIASIVYGNHVTSSRRLR